MRRLLRRIGARTGISLVLVLVIGLTLLIARLIDDRRSQMPYPRSPDTAPIVTSTEGDDSADDEEPTTYPDDAAVLAVAADFAEAWLRPDVSAQEWLDGLRPHATEELIENLSGVDPSEVPAHASLGPPTIAIRNESRAEVLIPIAPHDALDLGLVSTDTGWRVATLDRETG